MSSITIIKPKTNPFDINWKEIWESRDLFYFLTWRDIKVRYKQTLLGILWIIIQPLISIILFTIIFGNFAKIPSDNIPYPLFVFIGLFYWNFFSAALNSASNSLLSNENILKKVYFPKIMAPVSSTFALLVDLLPLFLILAGMLAYYKVVPTFESILIIPLLIAEMLILALGVGMLLAPINVRFRDVRHLLPFLIQLGFYVTPVIYPATFFGGTSKIIRIINPVAQVIDTQRLSFYAGRNIDWSIFAWSMLFSISIFLIGFYYFRTQEDKFIDYL